MVYVSIPANAHVLLFTWSAPGDGERKPWIANVNEKSNGRYVVILCKVERVGSLFSNPSLSPS